MCSAPVSTWKYSESHFLTFSTRLHDFFCCVKENDRLLQAELSDLTFNGPSTTYCDEEAALISTICESTRALNEPIDIPNYIGYSPGNAEECDIHVNAIAFTQAIIDYETECDFQSSIGSISALTSANVQLDSPFIDEEDHLDTGMNLYPANIATTIGKQKGFTTEHLSKVFHIDKETADRTLNCTTQLKKCETEGNLLRHFSTNDRMLRYKRINTHFFTNTFKAKKGYESKRGYSYVQLFVSDKGFIFVVFMKKRSKFPLALKTFAKEVGVPTSLIMDPAGEQTSNAVKKFAKECSMTLKVLEESTQWANLAERYIGLLKAGVKNDMHHSNCPIVLWLWDYCIERRVRVHNVTARDSLALDNQNPTTVTTGDVADISNLGRYDFYEPIYYWENKHQFPMPTLRIGRALGPTKYEGNEMAQYVLDANGRVLLPRRLTKPIPPEHLRTDNLKERLKIFDACIKKKLGDSMNKSNVKIDNDWTTYEDDETEPRTIMVFN